MWIVYYKKLQKSYIRYELYYLDLMSIVIKKRIESCYKKNKYIIFTDGRSMAMGLGEYFIF